MNLLIAISTVLYTALLATAIAGIYRLRSKSNDTAGYSANEHSLSVIIPFRNEAANIANIINDLVHQKSPRAIEIIGVDDHSEDDTKEKFSKNTEGRTEFQVLSLDSRTGKKNALSYGISQATGDFIATLDADVQLPAGWASTIHQYLPTEAAPDMLVLPLKIAQTEHSALSFFQVAENMAIQGLGFGLAAFNLPVSCNGANLVFRKSAFYDCEGYQKHRTMASGDDVFLMQAFLKSGKRIQPVFNPAVVAEVDPAGSWREMVDQRLRWAGKSGSMTTLPVRLSGGILLVFTGAMLITPLLPDFNMVLWSSALGVKVIVDVVLIKTTEKTYNLRLNPLKLALVAVSYIIFLPLVSLLSIWWKPKWKGRKL